VFRKSRFVIDDSWFVPHSSGMNRGLTHLALLEAESIHILRETAAQFERPVMLFSMGKDSTVLLHLAKKAFFPGPVPFPLLHIDSTWDVREVYEFRDRVARQPGVRVLSYSNPDGLRDGINPFDHGSKTYNYVMRTQALVRGLQEGGYDAALGGARRDEERSRAKERVFSFRDRFMQWEPKSQRPEVSSLYNGRVRKGESVRVFPLSNWTELDVWLYLHLEKIDVVPLYFASERPVVEREGQLIVVDDERMRLLPGEQPRLEKVRFRTLGCYPPPARVRSDADSLEAILQEMVLTKQSERQGRLIDFEEDGAMEAKKREGYF